MSANTTVTTVLPGPAPAPDGPRPSVDPVGAEQAAPAVPFRPRRFTRHDLLLLLGCAISSLLTCWLAYYRLTTAEGWLGFLLVWYALFVGLYYVVCREASGHIFAVNKVVGVFVATAATLMFAPLLWLLVFVVAKGLPALRPGFFLRDQAGVIPTDPPTSGGGLHSIVGTLEQVGLALLISVPLSLLTAVFLSETRYRLRRLVRAVVDAMSGLPSVVAGLFVFAALVIPISEATGSSGFSGLMAALALSIVMIPTITRTVEVVLRLVPDGLREASYALGASRPRTVWSVVLPTARSGLATAVVLGVARAVGETAPLIFTAFGYNELRGNPFSGQQDSLPLFVYARVQLQSEEARSRGFTGALVLVSIVLVLFLATRLLGRRRTGRR